MLLFHQHPFSRDSGSGGLGETTDSFMRTPYNYHQLRTTDLDRHVDDRLNCSFHSFMKIETWLDSCCFVLFSIQKLMVTSKEMKLGRIKSDIYQNNAVIFALKEIYNPC